MRRHRIAVAVAAGIAQFAVGHADARPRHQHPHHVHHRARIGHDANGNSAVVIGGRPAGCPRAFCGCGLRKYLGLDDRRLDLAWNWARFFPRTLARPGAAAVRPHHVMLLERHIAGTKWLVRDYNGGRHLAWLHVRDVHGYVFVEPGMRMGALR